ncbi:MAG: hypothetical protein JO340_05290 [Acidobacteriaceae bacterium]|nr:hypothetical protein [Acidobacteriaceae bacterium]
MKLHWILPVIGGLAGSYPTIAAPPSARPQPVYEAVDVGMLPWVSYDVAPHLSASGVISWWQPGLDGAIHAFVWTHGSLQDLGTLASFAASIASRTNRMGETIGWSVSGRNLVDSGATTRAFLHSGSQTIDLGTLGGRDSRAADINDKGEIAGSASLSDGSVHAFIYREGKLKDLGTLPGGSFSAAYAINAAGVIAGAAETSTHLIHAVLWNDDHVLDLGTLPGGSRGRALALNDAGDVAGFSEADDAETHAFVYTHGRMQDLGSLGMDPIRANAINNHGQIVGASGVTRFVRHAFVWRNGVMQDLNKLIAPGGEWRLEDAFDVNDTGQILCLGARSGALRDRHLILLSPLPTRNSSDIASLSR